MTSDWDRVCELASHFYVDTTFNKELWLVRHNTRLVPSTVTLKGVTYCMPFRPHVLVAKASTKGFDWHVFEAAANKLLIAQECCE